MSIYIGTVGKKRYELEGNSLVEAIVGAGFTIMSFSNYGGRKTGILENKSGKLKRFSFRLGPVTKFHFQSRTEPNAISKRNSGSQQIPSKLRHSDEERR